MSFRRSSALGRCSAMQTRGMSRIRRRRRTGNRCDTRQEQYWARNARTGFRAQKTGACGETSLSSHHGEAFHKVAAKPAELFQAICPRKSRVVPIVVHRLELPLFRVKLKATTPDNLHQSPLLPSFSPFACRQAICKINLEGKTAVTDCPLRTESRYIGFEPT